MVKYKVNYITVGQKRGSFVLEANNESHFQKLMIRELKFLNAAFVSRELL